MEKFLKGVHSDQPIDKLENLREFYYSMPHCSAVEFRQVIDDLVSKDTEQAVFEVPEQAESMQTVKGIAPGLVNKNFRRLGEARCFFCQQRNYHSTSLEEEER
jgi:hypothetical protein